MRFIATNAPGGPEVLTLQEGPVPQPGPGEVLIRVGAAGINRADTYQRRGRYPMQPGFSNVLGLEVAGTVEALGSGVERWNTGDQVCALVSGGGYAEYCVAHATHCLPVPNGLSLAEGASLPEAMFTVWLDVFQLGQLHAGQNLLVHGGSSGIGTAAIQMAQAMGAKAYVTCGSAAKVAACEALGAVAVNYRETDFEIALQATPMHVILDMVGGRYIDKNLRLLAKGGRLVFINFMEGSRAEVDFSPLMAKGAWITGSLLRPQPVEVKAKIASELEAQIWPHVSSTAGAGRIQPVIDKIYPLAEAAEAHRRMESSAHIGKIVLAMA